MKIVQACVVTLMLLACADESTAPDIELVIRNHLFVPDKIHIPADTKVRLVIHNNDATPEEFESRQLNREKLIMGNSTTAILLGPLPKGEYAFFGAFNAQTAIGSIVVEDTRSAN